MGATGVNVAARPVLCDGLLNVNKPMGWTSHDVVAKLRGLLKGLRVGHAGTLDPAATGVLPVLVGRGTRLAEYLMDWDKEYLAVLRLGETTDTQDATGIVVERHPTDDLRDEEIRAVVSGFRGRLAQVPPMYSAVKVGGVPLYKSARAGLTVQRGPREVTVQRIEVREIAGRDVTLHLVCSKGTYVRTLCADIGEALRVGGHLLALERRRVGPLAVERALTIEELSAEVLLGRLTEVLIPMDTTLEHFPAVLVDEVTAGRILHGVPVPLRAVRWEQRECHEATGQPIRLKDLSGRLLAVGKISVHGSASEGPQATPEPRVAILKVLADP